MAIQLSQRDLLLVRTSQESPWSAMPGQQTWVGGDWAHLSLPQELCSSVPPSPGVGFGWPVRDFPETWLLSRV